MSYTPLLTSYINGTISTKQFEEIFLDKYKNEKEFNSDKEFKALYLLFEDVDAYYDSTSETFDPECNINELQLRQSAINTLNKIQS